MNKGTFTSLVIGFSFLCFLVSPLLNAKKRRSEEEFVRAKMVFKLTQEGHAPYYSWVSFLCVNGHCSWDEMTTLSCIGGKTMDPYAKFPEIYHYTNGSNGNITVTGGNGNYHVVWNDGTGNFWFEFDCSKSQIPIGCKVKSARGIITDATAEFTTKYEYIPIFKTIEFPCG